MTNICDISVLSVVARSPAKRVSRIYLLGLFGDLQRIQVRQNARATTRKITIVQVQSTELHSQPYRQSADCCLSVECGCQKSANLSVCGTSRLSSLVPLRRGGLDEDVAGRVNSGLKRIMCIQYALLLKKISVLCIRFIWISLHYIIWIQLDSRYNTHYSLLQVRSKSNQCANIQTYRLRKISGKCISAVSGKRKTTGSEGGKYPFQDSKDS